MTPTLRVDQGREGALGAIEKAWAAGCRRQLISYPTGCHRRGQGILLFDGRVARVEDVCVGDQLMGPDSQPRHVLALARGEEEMVEIRPVSGSPWVVNRNHVLTLVRTREKAVPTSPCYRRSGEIVDVSIPDWSCWSKTRKHLHKLFRVGVDFPVGPPLPFDPYWLGLLLGDGTLWKAGRVSFTTADEELLAEAKAVAAAHGLRLRKELITYHFVGIKKKRNPLATALASLGLSGIACRQRFVPKAFRLASRRDRLAILAGLLDTDGHQRFRGFEFSSMSERLAGDVAFLARSLGLSAYIGRGTVGSFRVAISGDCSVIPCRVMRKKALPRRQKKDVLRTGFTVQPLGAVEPYYGFTLDGDGRYLLDDFTVTHNCGKTVIFSNLPTVGFRRLLVVAHREELLDQAADKLRHWNPGLTVQVDQADRWADVDTLAAFDGELFAGTGYAVCASVATIGRAGGRRLTRYPTGLFDAIVVDEAHHASAQSYQSVIDHFGAGKPGGPLLLGVTATPFRADGADLSKVFEKVVYSLELPDAIVRGYLVDIRALAVATGVNLDGVGATREDFKVGELADAVNTPERNGRIVKAYIDHAADRKGIVFAADVQHSKDLAEAFEAAGVASRHVDGTTPGDERAATFAWMREQGPRVLTNVGVACLDEESEVLTSTGWVGCDAITKDHEVANWEDGRIRFAPPLAIEVRERRPDERMVVLETKNRSIRVTEDHRMLYRTTRDGAFRVARARALAGRAAQLPICGEAVPLDVTPQQAIAVRSTERRRIQQNAHMLRKAGLEDAAATAEATRRVRLRDELGYAAPASLSEAECEFIGFWLGDGTRQALKSGGVEYLLWQGQSHPGLCAWIDGLIGRTGVDAVRRILPPRRAGGSPVVEWSLCRGTGFGPQRRRGLYRLEPYLVKAGSPLLWGLDGAQFAALLCGFWMADGDHGQAAEPVSDGWRICNTNRGLLDLLQSIAVCRGYRANITDGRTNTKKGYKPLWRLSVSRRASHAMTKFRLRFEADPWRAERVWCVKVDSGFIVTRRRGAVTVTGNTEGYDEPSISVVLLARPTKSRVLYSQMVGRITRLCEGKTDALVIDLADVSSKHTLVGAAALFGLPTGLDLAGKSATKARARVKELVQQGLPFEELSKARTLADLETIANEYKKVSLFWQPKTAPEVAGISALSWVSVGDGAIALRAGELRAWITTDMLGHAHLALRRRPAPVPGTLPLPETLELAADFPTLEKAVGAADALITAEMPKVFTDPKARWRKDPASEKQVALLKKFRVPYREPLTKGEAGILLDKVFARRGAVRRAS